MGTGVTWFSDGAVVSMVKELTERLSLVTLLVVTLMVQLSCVPSPRELKVTVLLSLPTAEVLLSLSQFPP